MAAARLLDLTRSLRRAGRMATGVDRVEHAYLSRFLAGDTPCFGLFRTPLGYLLLDREGLKAFEQRLNGVEPWGPVSLVSRIGKARDRIVQQAESDLRRLAVARARRGRLPAMLSAHLPQGFDAYNVGHSNLTDRVLRAIHQAGGNIHVLIHDVIPLEHPEFQRPGTVETFRGKLRRVGAKANRVIYNSQDTRRRAEQWFSEWGRVPAGIVAHLGTVVPVPDAASLPEGLPPERPFFVTVGTIEPRKNHALLLDIWDELGPDAPPLLICGSRGWNNREVFARLDALPPKGPVRELPGLSDGAVAHLVACSAGLLFPSIAEGYGLPPLEAVMLGTPVLCADLPVYREFLGDKVVYADPNDRYLWSEVIKSWAERTPGAPTGDVFRAPDWHDHFKTVLRLG